MADLKTILQRPVPDYTHARNRRQQADFRKYPLRPDGPHNGEPLVDIALYGIAGQSYYSRPNGATGQAVPGVPSAIYVRQSIAERLRAINYALQQSEEAAELLGGKVELYVNEGYRSAKLQRQLYEKTFPALISKQYPDYTRKQVLERRDQLIAAPPREDSPSPHATGAAVDVRLRYIQADSGFVAGSGVLLGNTLADTSEAVYPDYFEQPKAVSKKDQEIQRNRRIFYWIMRGALIGDDSGFVVNPTEWWHWSYGDQLWAELTNAPEAFFSFIAPPEVD